MKLTFIEPNEELKPYIQSLWVFESQVGMPPGESNLAAPNGCSKLIVPYENSVTSIADGRVQESYEQGLYFVAIALLAACNSVQWSTATVANAATAAI